MQIFVKTSLNPSHADNGETLYCWRRRDNHDRWQETLQYGSGRQLAAALNGTNASLVLVLPGSAVVTHSLACKSIERKHLADLAPFELEDDIVQPLDKVHVAIGKPAGENVAVACIDRALLQENITALEALGLEVAHCIPEPLLLPRPANGWCLQLLDGEVRVHHGTGLGFAVDTALAATVLGTLAAGAEMPEQVILMADSRSSLDTLHALLPARIADKVSATELTQAWDTLIPARASPVDLRQGSFARRLPLRRWWVEARGVALLGAAALAVYVASTLAQIQIDKARSRTLQQEITTAYRAVMPDGVLVDAEQQLRNQLALLESSTGGAIPLLAAVAPFFAAGSEVDLHRLSYNEQSHELQLTVGADTNADILALSEALQRRGLQAQPRNLVRHGQGQQANLTITENAR